MWDFATGKEEARFPGHNGGVSQAAITPDGKRFLAASADGVLRVWDVGTRKLVAESKGHEGAILAVAIAPNGTWAATAGADETVRLFGLPE
jgi:WD40 repeat protein